MKWKNEKDELERLINIEHVSYEEIGRRYNVSGNAVRKAARSLGINLPKRRTINPKETFNKGIVKKHLCLNCGKEFVLHNTCNKGIYCSTKCQQEYLYKEYIKRWQQGEENGKKGEYGISNYIRHYLFDKYNNKCQLCGWSERNEFTNSIPLEIHHIDGDYTNNKEENLQLLCPNCHSLTETHKLHNKKGRQGRKKYYIK